MAAFASRLQRPQRHHCIDLSRSVRPSFFALLRGFGGEGAHRDPIPAARPAE
jgi:hypothetical protein